MANGSPSNQEFKKESKGMKDLAGMAEGNSSAGEDLSNKEEVAARLSNAEGSMDDQKEDQEMADEGQDAFVDADVEADEDVKEAKEQMKH